MIIGHSKYPPHYPFFLTASKAQSNNKDYSMQYVRLLLLKSIYCTNTSYYFLFRFAQACKGNLCISLVSNTACTFCLSLCYFHCFYAFIWPVCHCCYSTKKLSNVLTIHSFQSPYIISVHSYIDINEQVQNHSLN
jgi:hypothetical protein